jgi:hypothetical protein
MQKVNWLIEKNICDRNDEFLAELSKQGYFYQEVSYLNFLSEGANKFFPDDECVLFRGTLNLGRNILKTSWIPGAYMDDRNLRCSTYYTYFGNYLLNKKYFLITLGELIRRKNEILEYFDSDGDLFIRPDSNLKPFEYFK